MAPVTYSSRLVGPLAPIDPYKPFQPEITATWVTLEAKNVPLIPPQTWWFQAKNGPLQRLFWTHCASGMPPITAARCLTCPLGLTDSYEPFHPEITATWVIFEAKNVPLAPPQIWEFLTKLTFSRDCYGPTGMHYGPHRHNEVFSVCPGFHQSQ